MIVLLIALLNTLILVEISIRAFGSQWVRNRVGATIKNLSAFSRAGTDNARQRLILLSGRLTIQLSLVVLLFSAALIIIAFSPLWLLAWDTQQQSNYLIALTVMVTVWSIGRASPYPRKFWRQTDRHIVQTGSYSLIEQWLHWLALEPMVTRRLAFDLERLFFLPQGQRCKISPTNQLSKPSVGAVYVCGLARSGTTMLLGILDQVEVFRSLSYRDMPFVMAPNIWRRISRLAQREAVLAERSHGDGIKVDYDSPEAFEEVFWRTFCPPQGGSQCFGACEPNVETLAAFADYRALIANVSALPDGKRGLNRYLSKNNNNLLRLRSLCTDPTASVLLVYRNPVATARSLFQQHKRFKSAQKDDLFTLRYMKWLAHHEFGLAHRPFCFAIDEMDNSLTPDNPNYWLDYWDAVYRGVLTQLDLPIRLVDHDAMCEHPVRVLNAILTALGVEADASLLAQQIAPTKHENASTDEFDSKFLGKAEVTYRALLLSSRNVFQSTS